MVFVCALFLLGATGTPTAYTVEQIIQRLDGRVLGVNENERLLFVEFEHPVSGEFVEKKFIVSDSAGFKHFKKLSKLREGDLVSVDYLEGTEGLVAIYIIHVPLKLAYTTRSEVAKTLFRIKSG